MPRLQFLRGFFVSLLLGFISFYFIGCDKIPFLNPTKPSKVVPKEFSSAESAKTPLARVNNIPIALEDFNEELDFYNASVPADKSELKITDREQKINYLKNEMVQRVLLYQEALNRGLDKKEDIRRVLEKNKQDLLVIELIKQEAEKVAVSPQEVEEYYNTYKEQMKEPEERHLREIVVPTEFEAKDIMVQLWQGADFATLAKERSKAASAAKGGDLGYLKEGAFPQFNTTAFSDALEVGKFTSVFKGPDGYYIVKLEDKRLGKQNTLSELYDDIKNGLILQKQQETVKELIDKLSRSATIEINEGEIK